MPFWLARDDVMAWDLTALLLAWLCKTVLAAKFWMNMSVINIGTGQVRCSVDPWGKVLGARLHYCLGSCLAELSKGKYSSWAQFLHTNAPSVVLQLFPPYGTLESWSTRSRTQFLCTVGGAHNASHMRSTGEKRRIFLLIVNYHQNCSTTLVERQDWAIRS